VTLGRLPDWASAGFSEGAVVPHVVGDEGRIVAVPFSQPLIATADGQPPQNKVLLVARTTPQGPAPVTIDARLVGTDVAVRRLRPEGPGPGVLDLPRPGCWTLTLRWANESDTLQLEYRDREATTAP
jgi:hypothetical protein